MLAFFFFLLACQGQRALSCFMSFLRRRPSQQSVAAWSSVLLCASRKGKIQISLIPSDFHQHWKMINGMECAAGLDIENL